jgi:hypothetical protein
VKRSTRTKLAIAITLVVGFVLIVVQPRSDEKAALDAFKQVAAILAEQPGEAPEARDARLRRELAVRTAPDVSVALPGGVSLTGRDAVIDKALELTRGRRPVITFKEVRSGRRTKTQVRVAFEVLVSDSQAGDLHARPRSGEAEMLRGDHGYRLHWLEVGAEARAEPEPRP